MVYFQRREIFSLRLFSLAEDSSMPLPLIYTPPTQVLRKHNELKPTKERTVVLNVE